MNLRRKGLLELLWIIWGCGFCRAFSRKMSGGPAVVTHRVWCWLSRPVRGCQLRLGTRLRIRKIAIEPWIEMRVHLRVEIGILELIQLLLLWLKTLFWRWCRLTCCWRCQSWLLLESFSSSSFNFFHIIFVSELSRFSHHDGLRHAPPI